MDDTIKIIIINIVSTIVILTTAFSVIKFIYDNKKDSPITIYFTFIGTTLRMIGLNFLLKKFSL